MNLIDAEVTRIIEKRQFTAPEDWGELAGKVYDLYVVEYVDMGGTDQTELWFEADQNVIIEVGHVFQH